MNTKKENMLDFLKLSEMGIIFKNEEEKRYFEKHLEQELCYRVGEAISRGMTEQQLDEFDLIMDDPDEERAYAASLRWLEKYCPSYETVVRQTEEIFRREVAYFKDDILNMINSNSCEERREEAE